MATPSVSINPVLTTNALGSFGVSWGGGMQGTALNDPEVRYSLAGGYLDPAETIPMWGGVGISENIPGAANTPMITQGGPIRRATSIGPLNVGGLTPAALNLTGFSVFDQAHAMINSPQSPVPLAGGYMSVNFYRLGSKARIWLNMDPALVSLDGSIITSLVSWDFALQRLCQYIAAYPANVITASSWSAGIATYTTTTSHGVAVGDSFTITGETPSGYNGTFIAQAGTTGSTLTAAIAVNPGASTVQGTLVAGGGAVPVRILDIVVGTSMTVNYDPVTGFATWNRSGSAAVCLI